MNIKLMSAACLALSSSGSPAADFEFGYDPPPIADCSDIGGLGVQLSSDKCLLVHLYSRLDVGYDSSAGLVWDHEARARAALVTQTDFGGLAGVVTLTSARDFYWADYEPQPVAVETGAGEVVLDQGDSDSGSGYTTGKPRIDEAYLQLGDQTRLRVGKVETLIDLEDDKPLTELGATLFLGTDWSVSWRSGLLRSEKDYTAALQLISEAGDFTFAGSIEDLSRGGTVVGVVRYDDEVTSAHLTTAYFAESGDDDDPVWGVHAGIDSEFETASLVTAVAYDSSRYWTGLASGLISLGAVELVATGQANETGDRTLGFSAMLNLSDEIRLTVSAEKLWAPEQTQTRLLGTGIAIGLYDCFELSAEVGALSGDDLPLRYVMLSAKADLPSGFGGNVKGTLTDQGGYKVESSIVQRLQ